MFAWRILFGYSSNSFQNFVSFVHDIYSILSYKNI